MKTELKKVIIDFIFEHENEFQVMYNMEQIFKKQIR